MTRTAHCCGSLRAEVSGEPSRASRPAPTEQTPASSSRACPHATRVCFTKSSTAGAARRRTTSRRGRRTLPPIARPAQGERQPVPAVSACRRVLAPVEPALPDAQTLAVARGAVRHLAPSPDQDRRARGRAEDDDPASPATACPSQAILRAVLGRIRVWSHHDGAHAPDPSPSRSTRKPQCAQTARFTSGGRFHPASCRLRW